MNTQDYDTGVSREAELENLLGAIVDAVDQEEVVYIFSKKLPNWYDELEEVPCYELTQGFEDLIERARVALAREEEED